MTARRVLEEAGYDAISIDAGRRFADRKGWDDEDERGSLALAHILYDEGELERSIKAPWEPVCCSQDEE